MLPEDDNAGAARPCEGGVSPSANRHHPGVESKGVAPTLRYSIS